MGEQAEYMLSGDDCAMCGEYMGVDAGIPCYCSRSCYLDAGYPKEDWPVHREFLVSLNYHPEE